MTLEQLKKLDDISKLLTNMCIDLEETLEFVEELKNG
jgi:hypothetical protein